MQIRKNLVQRLLAGSALLCVLMLLCAVLPGSSAPPPQYPGTPGPDVFTPAHSSPLSALLDFLDMHPKHPAQPIQFPHATHIAKGLPCMACHTGVDVGPDATIPGVKFCMTCHSVIATDRPEIKKVAAYQARGEDIPWVRVYDYSASAHLKFNHAPHIRAGVDCSSCHGDLSKQTTAERAVNLTMGKCLDCHKERKAPTDCLTCHV